jgi:hypothetical protein
MFCFFISDQAHIPSQWHKKVGQQVQVIAVPVLGGMVPSIGFIEVDPARTSVARLRETFKVNSVPANALITPALEVIIGSDRVLEYLKSHFPKSFDGNSN